MPALNTTSLALCWVTLGLCLTTGPVCLGSYAGKGVATPMVLTQVPLHSKPTPADSGRNAPFCVGWYDQARVVIVSPKGEVRVLSQGFQAACDPDVSFDGTHVLFAGKKDAHSPWAIWESSVEGGECRQVSRQAHDCRSPVYLSSLFTLDSAGPWLTVLYVGQEGTLNEQGTGYATSLYSAKLDGTEPRRITFNPKGDLDPMQMQDGRVVYGGWRNWVLPGGTGPQPPLKGANDQCSLFAINIDGTDQELYGAEQGRRVQRMPCATEQGLIVFVEADMPSREAGGQLALVEQRRPHHSYRRVPADPRFNYLNPSSLRGNTILVSRRAPEGKSGWSVVALDVESGQAQVVYENRGFNAVQAKAVRPRTMPDGRSTVVNLEHDSGILYALNLYETDPMLKGHLAPGSIRRVRLVEGVPALGPPAGSNSCSPSAFGRRLLGEAPVEEDGSLHVLVPADTPLELQALDAEGLALATCRWIWVKQKENRGCIGCHEDPELVPENLYALAVRRPANNLALPVERRRSITFRQQVLPLLQAKCAAADCHGGRQPPRLGLPVPNDDGGTVARAIFEILLSPESPQRLRASPSEPSSQPHPLGAGSAGFTRGKYVDPGCARTSFLIWELAGRDTSRPWDQAGGPLHSQCEIKPMPPPGKAAPLTKEEFRLLVEWIDLGAAWEVPPPSASVVTARPASTPKPVASAEKGGM